MASAVVTLTRRSLLGHSAVAGAAAMTHAMPRVARAASLSAAAVDAPQKVRFDVADSYVVGNLFLPTGYRAGTRHPAVVVGGSLTAVKEMMGGSYAAAMAERGFIALAVDYRHYGESGGEARQYEDPDAKAEDLSAAVTYLAARSDVRADGIALVGVCTSGGTVLYAAARDERIAAVASVASHLAEPAIAPELYGGTEGVERRRAAGRAAREKYRLTGGNELILAYSDKDQTASHVGPMEYYMDLRRGGGVRQWTNAFAVMSWEPWLDFDPVREAARVAVPAVIVHTDNCALPGQARKVYDLLKGPKRLHWTAGNHFDFYDGAAKIGEAADAINGFFREHLG